MKPEDFNQGLVLRARYPAFSFPNMINGIMLATDIPKEEIGHKLSYFAFVFKDDKRIGMIGDDKDIARLKDILLKKIIYDKDYIQKNYSFFNKTKKELLRFIRQNLTKENVLKSNNRQLYSLLRDYYKKYELFGYPLTKFMYFMTDLIEQEIKSRIKEEHYFLLESPYLSYVNEFEMDYYKICLKTSLYLSKRWGWIPFDYLGNDEWNTDYFLKKMGADAENIKKIQSEHFELIKKQNKILNEYDSKTARLIRDFHLISNMQDVSKGVRTLSHVYLQKYLFEEISKRIKINKRYLSIMVPEEIKSALLNNKQFDKSIFEDRIKSGLVLFYNNKFFVFQGKNDILNRFLSFIQEKKEIKGTIASKGKVQGTVRICLTSKDISKVQLGNILVAPMTTPDYVPAMKKAAGFITDEGGITCHAAVIAREMKKPCIIGTISATELLKDGDFIELDAEQGIIKKLN